MILKGRKETRKEGSGEDWEVRKEREGEGRKGRREGEGREGKEGKDSFEKLIKLSTRHQVECLEVVVSVRNV